MRVSCERSLDIRSIPRGRLARRRRESHFPELTDAEVEDMVLALRHGFRMGATEPPDDSHRTRGVDRPG